MRFILVFITASTLLSHSLFAQDIKVVAHRGGVNWGPENTMATFQIAIDKGVDYIEMDVRQTKDGVFVLMHDQSVSRTTNGNGKLKELNWEDVQTLDAGSWYSEEFKNEPVPKLVDVLRLLDGKVLPDLDFKAGDPSMLIHLLQEEGFLDGRPLTLYSGNHQLLNEIQSLSENILIRPGIKSSYEDLKNTLDPKIINLSWNKFSPKLQNKINTDDKESFVNCLFTANRKRAIKKAVNRNADFIQTDKLDFLLNLLNR